MAKWVIVSFDLCKPADCDPVNGICPATGACKRKVLRQEETGEPPILLSRELCRGCRDCVSQCPRMAITKSPD
ncbi:MAG: 4Fe-4S binding protein [Planctomycetota bacterium]|jgi:translation initiation factor RLI1